MPLLKTEAEKLSNNQLEQGVVEEIIDKDDMFAFLPFKGINGKAYVYNREGTLSEGAFVDPNEVVPEGASTATEVTTNLRIIIGDVDVDKFLEETMGDTNDQKSVQIAAKAKGIGRKFKNALINGNNAVNAKEFDGISKLVTATGNILHADGSAGGTAGGAITLDMIDELLDAVPNGADVLIMRKGTLRALKALWRAAGGNTGNMLQINNFGMVVPAHDGTPILINDFIAGDVAEGTSTATCSIYAARFNEVDGLHGLFGGKTAGIRVEDIGTVQNKDATRTRVKFYTGLALKSTKSLAAVRGITNV